MPIGELDLNSLRQLRGLVDEVVVRGRAIVLDLAQLTFIEGSVIHWFVEISDATGRPVVLRNVSPTRRSTHPGHHRQCRSGRRCLGDRVELTNSERLQADGRALHRLTVRNDPGAGDVPLHPP